MGTRNPFRYRGYYYDAETGLYYLNSRYYSPEFGRFISADVFVSTGQGLVGSNMFAYCNNNPVMGYDPSGELANWLVGGIIGGVIGAFSSKAQGGSFWAGAVQGFTSGAIAGAAVDIALATAATGGAAALLFAGAIAYAGGYIGNVVGEESYSVLTEHRFIEDTEGMHKRSVAAGIFNVLSFTNAYCIDAVRADKGTEYLETITKRKSTVQIARENLSNLTKTNSGDPVSFINTSILAHVATKVISTIS